MIWNFLSANPRLTHTHILCYSSYTLRTIPPTLNTNHAGHTESNILFVSCSAHVFIRLAVSIMFCEVCLSFSVVCGPFFKRCSVRRGVGKRVECLLWNPSIPCNHSDYSRIDSDSSTDCAKQSNLCRMCLTLTDS